MNLTQQTRRNLRIAIRDGIEVRPAGPESLDEFMRLMTLTGERDGFATRPKAYFERFLSALGEHARLYLGFYEGRAISGAITTNFGGKACYVYGASDNECRNHMPNYLMQWEMIRWALETGCTVYDFQGVSGNLSPEGNHMYGLYRFKKGFNGQLCLLYTSFRGRPSDCVSGTRSGCGRGFHRLPRARPTIFCVSFHLSFRQFAGRAGFSALPGILLWWKVPRLRKLQEKRSLALSLTKYLVYDRCSRLLCPKGGPPCWNSGRSPNPIPERGRSCGR